MKKSMQKVIESNSTINADRLRNYVSFQISSKVPQSINVVEFKISARYELEEKKLMDAICN